jgi:hypothetical protein
MNISTRSVNKKGLGKALAFLCLFLSAVLPLSFPVQAFAGSPIDDYLAERRAAAGLSPVYSIPESTVRMPTFQRTPAEVFLEAEGAAFEAEMEADLFAPQQDTVGFARRYRRSSNPFADGFASTSRNTPGSAFNPVTKNDPDNPLNPMNRFNRDNPFNPMNEGDPRNPASGFNRGVYGLPFEPLR